MTHVFESVSRDAVAKMKNHWLLISLIEGNLELEFLACSLLLIFQFPLRIVPQEWMGHGAEIRFDYSRFFQYCWTSFLFFRTPQLQSDL